MTIRVDSGWTAPLAVQGWPLPGQPHFASSRAYRIFLRELRRYTIEEVSGRSILIAGHRGAGKTALVNEAVRVLRTKLIQEAASSDAGGVSRRTRLQRPLIVKLVGQSLVSPPPPKQDAKPAAPKASPSGEGDKPAGADDKPVKPAVEEPDEAASALVHITIALYRSLAAEVAQGFTNHAREADRRKSGDRLEVAAQFTLDLDDAPDPALLRRRWSELGRLRRGVLWPAKADAKIAGNDIANQGMREIIALTTAAQAFQICLGIVTEKKSGGESASSKQALESKLDIKDMVGRLGAVLAGIGAGSAASFTTGGPTAVGVGLLVWLASAATLGWSGSRSRQRQQSLDYTFMRDRSVQTLDRDLPLVIERIRAAGLAPVFVIDELDKLDASTTVKTILSRLKHLMADYGFFCFLAGRDYFDDIERIVASQSYPNEHTFFSERLLVINSPHDLFVYLTGILKSDAPDDALPIATFALSSIYNSRLNFTDLMRSLARAVDQDDNLLLDSNELRVSRSLRLAAAYQLSVDEALRDDKCASRFRDDQTFAQLAIDTLYLIARRWGDSPNTEIVVSLEALEAYLLERGQDSGLSGTAAENAGDQSGETSPQASDTDQDVVTPAPVEAETDAAPESTEGQAPVASPASADQPSPAPAPATATKVDPADLRMAHQLLKRQIVYLANFSMLVDAIRARADAEAWKLGDIVPLELGNDGIICAVANGAKFQYRFLVDESGEAVADNMSDWLDDAGKTEIDYLLGVLTRFDRLLLMMSLGIDGLVDLALLPATLRSTLVLSAKHVLKGAGLAQLRSAMLENALTTARQLVRALSDNSAVLNNLLLIAQRIRKEAGQDAGSVRDILQTLSAYMPALMPMSDSRPASPDLRGRLPEAGNLGTPEGLDGLIGLLEADARVPAQRKSFGPLEVELAWARWRDRVLGWFRTKTAIVNDITLDDLLCAALGRDPGRLFRADLSTMGVSEWSRIALLGLARTQAGDVPPWVVFAGLRALGFDGKMLRAYLGQLPRTIREKVTPAEREAIERIVDGAPDRPPGMMVLAHTSAPPISLEEGRPMIIVENAAFEEYKDGLNLLASQGAFEGITNVVE